MKSYTALYPQICSLENLYEAARKARQRKTRREDVERFELHRERFIRQLHDELVSERWKPSSYRCFQIHDPKTRTISAAPYRDRVVHHALCLVIGPIIERRFVDDSFSCRKGKGTLAGRERCRQYTNRYRYALKCDIRKYFETIDHDVLIGKMARIIRCKPTLELCRRIVASSVSGKSTPDRFAGDEQHAPVHRPCGLPIGNLTSQLWANLYLDRMDHVIKEVLCVPGYARYTDDFILWADDKDCLHNCRARIAEELETECLCLHPVKTRIIPTRTGIPFLGFSFFPARAPRLLGECKRRFERRMRRKMSAVHRGETGMDDACRSAEGWKAFADYGNTKGLYLQYRMNGFG